MLSRSANTNEWFRFWINRRVRRKKAGIAPNNWLWAISIRLSRCKTRQRLWASSWNTWVRRIKGCRVWRRTSPLQRTYYLLQRVASRLLMRRRCLIIREGRIKWKINWVIATASTRSSSTHWRKPNSRTTNRCCSRGRTTIRWCSRGSEPCRSERSLMRRTIKLALESVTIPTWTIVRWWWMWHLITTSPTTSPSKNSPAAAPATQPWWTLIKNGSHSI